MKADYKTRLKDEYDYIVSIDYRNPGTSFNNDRACFIRYCKMQGHDAIQKGLLELGTDILNYVNTIEKE